MSPLEQIDYNKLRNQKSELIELINSTQGHGTSTLDGIVHLIDSIQDYAVSDLKKTETEVFGNNK